MRDTIFYVGGVGKSMVSITLVQFLIDKYGNDKTIQLIETDESNRATRSYEIFIDGRDSMRKRKELKK